MKRWPRSLVEVFGVLLGLLFLVVQMEVMRFRIKMWMAHPKGSFAIKTIATIAIAVNILLIFTLGTVVALYWVSQLENGLLSVILWSIIGTLFLFSVSHVVDLIGRMADSLYPPEIPNVAVPGIMDAPTTSSSLSPMIEIKHRED